MPFFKADFTSNTRDFPYGSFFPEASEKYRSEYGSLIEQLLDNGTRPTPERIEALLKIPEKKLSRKLLDEAFSKSESLPLPETSENVDFDPGYTRLTESSVRLQLNRNPENKRWLQLIFRKFCKRHNLFEDQDIVRCGNRILENLVAHVSYWEADSFPLDAMMELQNRYDWTFQSDVWSLREQLRMEADVIYRGWIELLMLARSVPLFVILNQCTPVDYFCSFLPKGVLLDQGENTRPEERILLFNDLKIASSEHRVLLEETREGSELEVAVQRAVQLGRMPVLCDCSRRRFPRAIMRAARFAVHKGWGIRPLGKMFDPASPGIPEAKSSTGFARITGNPVLTLFDPWPISDNRIVPQLPPEMERYFNQQPQTKPWQDDRIGARSEREMDHTGTYQKDSESWVVPVLGGWMRVDHVFQSRMARFLSIRDYENYGEEKSIHI